MRELGNQGVVNLYEGFQKIERRIKKNKTKEERRKAKEKEKRIERKKQKEIAEEKKKNEQQEAIKRKRSNQSRTGNLSKTFSLVNSRFSTNEKEIIARRQQSRKSSAKKLDLDSTRMNSQTNEPEIEEVDGVSKVPAIKRRKLKPTAFQAKRKKWSQLPEYEDCYYTTRHGYEIYKNWDPSQLHGLQIETLGPTPKGWCQKYWWDKKFPNEGHHVGGTVIAYTPEHYEVMKKINSALCVSFSDEYAAFQDVEGLYHSFSTKLESIVRPEHQIVRALIHHHNSTAYLFSNDDETSSPLNITSTKITHSKIDDSPNATTSTLKHNKKHRLLDTTLANEYKNQNTIRQKCRTLEAQISDCIDHLENGEKCWLNRYNATPLSSNL